MCLLIIYKAENHSFKDKLNFMTQLSILQETELLRYRSKSNIPGNSRKFNVEEAKFVFTEKILSFIPLHVQGKAFCFYFFYLSTSR